MDYHLLAFLIFVLITVSRQLHYFWHQSKQKRLNQNNTAFLKKDKIGSHLLYGIYVIIWLGTAYELYTNNFSFTWYAGGLFLVVVGFVMRVAALRDLGGSYAHEVAIWSNHKLVTHGLYAWIRHPIYLAMAIELLGMVIIGRNILLLIIWLLLIIVLIHRVLIEDKALATLGDFAKKYQTTVPAFNIFYWFFRKSR